MPNHDVQRLAERYPARRVLITSATSGLGEALALEFARHGWRIGVSGRSPDKVGAAARKVREVGGDALEIPLEVTDRRQFDDAAAIVGRAWGGLDILINNAGIAGGGRIDELTPGSWRTILDTNLWGVIHGCAVFVPVLRRAGGGHIVNVSSGAGFICAPEMASYSVSKAGVIALTETLRVELALDRIRCTVTCPGLFQSSIFDPAKIESASGVGRVVTSLQTLMAKSSWTSEEVAQRTHPCHPAQPAL